MHFVCRLLPTSPLLPYTTLFRSPIPPSKRSTGYWEHTARFQKMEGHLTRAIHTLHRLRHEETGTARDLAPAIVSNTLALPPTSKTSRDRKSTRLNSSHRCTSYAVFYLHLHSYPTRRSSDLRSRLRSGVRAIGSIRRAFRKWRVI